jgi:hypothetical protein
VKKPKKRIDKIVKWLWFNYWPMCADTKEVDF